MTLLEKGRYILNFDTYKIVFFFIIFFINSLGTYIPFLPPLLAIFEIFYLLYLFLKRNIREYVIYLLIFTITSVERVGLVSGDMYNILYLPYIGGYHYYVLITIPYILILKDYKFIFNKVIKTKKTNLTFFVIGIVLIFIINMITSVMTYFLNDNNLVSNGYYFLFFRRNFLSNYTLSSMIIFLYYFIQKNNKFVTEIKQTLFGLTISMAICMITCKIFNCVYYYGDSGVYMISLASFFLPSLCLFLYHKEFKSYKYLIILLSFISLLLSITNPSILAGKWWLLIICIIAMLFIHGIIYTYKKSKKLFIILTCIIISCLVILSNINLAKYINDPLLQGKLIQVQKLFDITNPNWFSNIPESPRFRLEEFINIISELLNKPIYLLQGKGMAGSVIPTINAGSWYDLGSFTINELNAGAFFNVHETINRLTLQTGLIGLIFFLIVMLRSILNIIKSPWIFIGIIWFIFYFGIFPSLWYGLAALIVGFTDIENVRTENEYLEINIDRSKI